MVAYTSTSNSGDGSAVDTEPVTLSAKVRRFKPYRRIVNLAVNPPMLPMRSVAERRAVFRRLHESGCFVLPNPWDIGSARLLQHLGFQAVASTSSGSAWSTGRPDYAVSRSDVLEHLSSLCNAIDLPVNADFESGFADEPDGVGKASSSRSIRASRGYQSRTATSPRANSSTIWKPRSNASAPRAWRSTAPVMTSSSSRALRDC